MTDGELAEAQKRKLMLDHFRRLIFEPRQNELSHELPPELASDDQVREIHQYMVELRRYLGEYAQGDFYRDICLRGALAGRLKALQANMMHLIWQMKRVEEGDFSQRVEFMGEFSENFNNMVVKLDEALTALRLKEEELRVLTLELETEVEKRGAALAQVRASEEKFKYLAEHDPLTGLMNRRSFADQTVMNLTKASLVNSPCCVAIMDVDFFKVFNDAHGHPKGDLALKHLVTVSQETLRSDDLMARHGGEEFVFFFSKASAENGLRAAERIRQAVATRPLLMDGSQLYLTVSTGVASLPPGAVTGDVSKVLEDALNQADEALYQAKNEGRNTVRLRRIPDKRITIRQERYNTRITPEAHSSLERSATRIAPETQSSLERSEQKES